MDNIKKIEDFLNRIQGLLDNAKKQGHIIVRVEDLENAFPELKESEDERIRKELLEHCKNQSKPYIQTGNKCPQIQSWIAWLEKQGQTFTKKDVDDAYLKGIIDAKNELEKQGEQKPAVTDFNAKDWYVSKVDGKIHDMTYNPADKVEPKFHEGDWINGYYTNYKVTAISNKGYVVEDTDGNKMNILFENEKFHNLWTIQDAKNGDVLADNGAKIIFIFKNIEYDSHIESNVIKYFIRYSFDGINLPLENGGHLGVVGEYSNFVPATKEQRDTLEKAMADAGYTFDFEKKELKKTEDEIEIPFGAKDSELQEETYFIPDGFHAEIDDDKVIIKKGEKPAAWSDEDENYLQSAENACEYQYGKNTSTILWLKSLKNRIGG